MATPLKCRVNRIVRRRGMILRIPLGGEAGLPTRPAPPRVRADTRPYTSPHAPIPKLLLRAAGRRGRAAGRRRPRGRGLQPRQGALPRGRPHQARPGALLPGRGRRRAPRRRRATQRDGPLPQRHWRRALLPEARAGLAPALGRGGHDQVPLGTERRGGGAAGRGGARVARQSRLPGAAPASGPRGRPRPSRRAAGGSRPGTRRGVGPGATGGAGGGGGARRAGTHRLAQDLGLARAPRHRPDRAAVELRAGPARGAGAGAGRGAARARARHQQVVEGGAARSVRGLQPERQGPHGRVGVLGASHSRRAGVHSLSLG